MHDMDELFASTLDILKTNNSDNTDIPQCTMGLSPCKMGNREFVSDYHDRPHFLKIQLFQREIFGDC